MEPLAHSARPSLGIPVQSYVEHVRNVMEQAEQNARHAAAYWRGDGERLVRSVRLAAEFHDLGKLDSANQTILMSGTGKKALPINHVDAGVAQLFNPQIRDTLAASLVYSHHIGLPDFQDQRNNKAGDVLRDSSIKSITDEGLEAYLQLHRNYVVPNGNATSGNSPDKPAPLLFRFALSCLVDADHQDTARNYRGAVGFDGPPLRAADRLVLLDTHIALLSKEKSDERTALRNAVYEACRNADTKANMYACDSAVGTGKTTAIMAHLLRAAIDKGLRRILVVLPFTNIIDQSVEVYRRALVILGERAEDVVAAHHHRAEFEDLDSRQFAFLWHAPIVVTTAVQFFETLASNRPAALRKLHQLAGSAIFIDEAHAALPTHLWPQAWRWLGELELEWGCHVVLGSGSLNRFWQLEEFSDPPAQVPELVSEKVHGSVANYEHTRLRYQLKPDPLSLERLLEWLPSLPGPRVLIVNTVQSAAAIASAIDQRVGRQSVEHLSTSLCPRDRKVTLHRVKARLDDSSDCEWTLVATSCVEAGVDLSFRTGLRERCSLNSLIQIGGRVNREGEHTDATVWDFQLRYDDLLRPHPAFDTSARVLGEIFAENHVDPKFCTEAMRREIRQKGMRTISDDIMKGERNMQFPAVAELFRVIDSDTVTAIVDRGLVSMIEAREKVDPNLLQTLSVQIWRYREIEYALKLIPGRSADLYMWTLEYDAFLGYMAGVLMVENFKKQGGCIV